MRCKTRVLRHLAVALAVAGICTLVRVSGIKPGAKTVSSPERTKRSRSCHFSSVNTHAPVWIDFTLLWGKTPRPQIALRMLLRQRGGLSLPQGAEPSASQQLHWRGWDALMCWWRLGPSRHIWSKCWQGENWVHASVRLHVSLSLMFHHKRPAHVMLSDRKSRRDDQRSRRSRNRSLSLFCFAAECRSTDTFIVRCSGKFALPVRFFFFFLDSWILNFKIQNLH